MLPCLHLAEEKQVVDDGQQMFATRPDMADIFFVLCVPDGAHDSGENEVGKSDNRVEWRPEFMAEIGDKYVEYLKGLGVLVESGEKTVERLYGKLE